METFETIADLKNFLSAHWENNSSIGFVPTMGALHQGHLSLVAEAKRENDVVVCSVYVNPIQFNNQDDLKNYPRTLESDIEKLNSANCDILFAPDEKEMFSASVNQSFDFENLDKVMEGKHRPGHFNGVALIVKKLFEIINPTRAYFGLKDYQQLVIIHKMTKQANLPVEIVPCLTVREPNGLAMSSRNMRLNPAERNQAAMIYETLKMVKIRSGFSTIREIHDFVEERFRKQKNMRLEYFEIVDMYSLKPLFTWTESNNVIACIAIWVGDVRLIDNMILFS